MIEERNTAAPETEESRNFILNLIDQDIAEGGQFQGQTVHARFPPEPNGYLHIGHCKALTIDFGTAEKFGGLCNLRMDDTNPTKEDEEFVEAIKEDIHWLGFDWGDRFFYGSDYFEKDYEYAVELIKKGLAYVCELTPEEFKANRGDIGIPATSPYRDRPIEENLRLFEKMKNGEVEEGKMTLRAKIDLASGNLNLRDPIIYRIRFINHHRQGTKWCIYPMYDFAHPIQDALEGITHSLCSLEFESHRPLYDWVVTKRKLRQLVEEKLVSGWDDPRMPTLCGLRRRGYTARSIRNFCERIGVAKSPNTVEYGFLEHCLREDLNATAQRTMAVLHPVKLTVTNYPEGQSETFTVENNPTGPECRLKGAYLIRCTGCVKDENGHVMEVLCEYDPNSRGGDPADGRKVKGATLHWVDADNCLDAEVRLYDNLFSDPQPDGPDKNFLDCLNPDSLMVLRGCKVERSMAAVAEEFDRRENRTGVNAPTFQFMRTGYFCMDNRDCTAEHLVFNRSVSLKDSFKK